MNGAQICRSSMHRHGEQDRRKQTSLTENLRQQPARDGTTPRSSGVNLLLQLFIIMALASPRWHISSLLTFSKMDSGHGP